MRKIRKLYWFDKKNTEEMISFLNNRSLDNYINHIMYNPFILLHHLLPLNLKFLPESYILKEDKIPKGLITIAPSKTPKRMEIQKLFFEEGALADAVELIQYAVSKYKAMGTLSIMVKVDDYLPELLTLLISKCGFSQISYEKLWRVNKFIETDFDKREYRLFKNSDANVIANLYNDSLIPHFRVLLNKSSKEFKEPFFRGLSYFSEYKYVIEDKKTREPIGCIIIKTTDNLNFIVDIIQTNWIELDINQIIAYAISQIKKRKTKFALFIRTKRYTQLGEKQERTLSENGFECVQNQVVLTNSTAKVLKEHSKSTKFTVISDFCPNNLIST